LHKNLYVLGNNLSKKDKLGIHAQIEKTCLEILILVIDAAYKTRSLKKPVLEVARIKIEVLKQLVRSVHELNIYGEKIYLDLQSQLQEISKMTNGWIKFVTEKEL